MTDSRQIAHELLMRVHDTDAYINLLLPKTLARHNVADSERGLIQELSYGALRWQLQYDGVIDHFTRGKELSQSIRGALQLGLHQLFRMRVPTHAAINETVNLAKRIEPRAAGLVNAVLRNAERDGLDRLLVQLTAGLSESKRLEILHSHPAWVIDSLRESLRLDGRESELVELLTANNETPETFLAASDDEALAALAEQGLQVSAQSPIGFQVDGNPEPYLSLGNIRVQDLGSQLVALVAAELAALAGRTLDMCSGPGGKSAILQGRIRAAGGELDCMEPQEHRAELVRQALGANPIGRVIVAPGQQAEQNAYDTILLDAPCSGLGSVRRKPESRHRKKQSQLASLSSVQR
ncbi:MAG: transcription antitermination factor NusB, partial [Aquiluna sp.]